MIIKPTRLSGTVTVPASKSQTIRAFLIAAFTGGVSTIRHPLLSADTISCINAVKSLGCTVETDEEGNATVDATYAFDDLEEITIDCGNSGTTEYLALPMLSSLGIPVTIIGDDQLSKRPVLPLLNALEDLGAETESEEGKLPATVRGPLDGGETTIECRTSQYLSGLLLGAPLSLCDTEINCSLLYEKPYVSMTLRWLDKQHIAYEISEDLEHSKVKGGQHYTPFDEYIEGDFSSASFFFVMAAIHGTSVRVIGLDRESTQGDKAILNILEAMGAKVEWDGNAVTVTGPEHLKGGEFDLNAIPDTLPVLAVAASFAEGDVHLTNVPQARIKETDRIDVMTKNLKLMGVDVEEEPDGMLIHGKGVMKGTAVKGYGDHRVIMAMATAASKADGETEIDNVDAVDVTFPTFFELYESLRG